MQSNDVYPIHVSQKGTKLEGKKDFYDYVELIPIPRVFILYVQILVLFYGLGHLQKFFFLTNHSFVQRDIGTKRKPRKFPRRLVGSVTRILGTLKFFMMIKIYEYHRKFCTMVRSETIFNRTFKMWYVCTGCRQ